MIRIILFFFALVSLTRAQESVFRQVFDTKTDTHVEVTSLFSHPSLGGYHPVRVVIANNQKIPHRISLDFKDSSNYRDGLSTSSSFSFVAPPGKTITQDILVPLTAQNGSTAYQSLKINLFGSMGKSSGSASSVFDADQPAVLLSESLYTPNGSALDTERNSRGSGGSYSGSSNGFSSKFDPKQLPDDWRAFSGFDTVMLTENDWMATPPGPRNAILSWLRLGGHLVVFSGNPPQPSAIGLPEDASFGRIDIKQIAADLRLDPKETVDLSIPDSPRETRLKSVASDFESAWPLQDAFGEKSFNYVFFVIILVIFGILVGPVNLFVFAKSGRRHRLFITTPIISITTSLILVGLIILQDGFGGDGVRMVLMEVRPDQNQNAAFVHQEQFSRTGVMTSPSFSLDASALMVPVPLGQSRWARFTDDYNTRGTYDIQPSAGKIFASGDWFQSRSEQGQLISAVVPTRGRIEATASPDTLISTFDFPLQTLVYRDESGNWFRAQDIVKGSPVKLDSVDPAIILKFLNDVTDRFSQRNQTFLNQSKMRKGHFVAITTEAPALATHKGIDWKTTTVITGPIAP